MALFSVLLLDCSVSIFQSLLSNADFLLSVWNFLWWFSSRFHIVNLLLLVSSQILQLSDFLNRFFYVFWLLSSSILIFWSKKYSSSFSSFNALSISRYWYSQSKTLKRSGVSHFFSFHQSFIIQFSHTNCRNPDSLLTIALIVQRWFVHSHLYQQVNSFNVKNSFMSLLNGLQPFSISLFNNCSTVILSQNRK